MSEALKWTILAQVFIKAPKGEAPTRVMPRVGTLDSRGNECGVDPRVPRGDYIYRVAFVQPPPLKSGAVKAPGLVIQRSYSFSKDGEENFGFSGKVGMLAPAVSAALIKVQAAVLTSGVNAARKAQAA